MGIFDIFDTSAQDKAAQDQKQGLLQGQAAATGNINSGIVGLNSNYTEALQPFLQNYSTAQGGVTGLQNLLGLNGQAGNASALQSLQNTPGYQFQQQQGNNAINAQAAATGQLASGNTALALSNYNQGLAGTTYQNAVSNLMPFLNQSNTAASGIGSLYSGLGNAVAGQYGNLANLNYSTATGIGNANANDDLAGLSASKNIWGAVGGAAGAAFGMPGLGSGLGIAIGGAVPGAVGPSSVGGANGPSPLTGSLYSSIFSDERLKENIEPVGELYDGTGVYRYNYIGDDIARIGVMAQEVEKTRPEAVTEIGGFKAVDYAKATDLAASLASFLDDKVVPMAPRRQVKADASRSVADLSRFLEAA